MGDINKKWKGMRVMRGEEHGKGGYNDNDNDNDTMTMLCSFFWGGWIEKRGESSVGYGFTEMQFLCKPFCKSSKEHFQLPIKSYDKGIFFIT